ncbi:TAXI family TRAP transporter solute-binding subunit [Salsuginibacillus kocurii]|uniref:TAXI family TRAP transporter solute-binding subunit n=1 Tax=Salsuginibacillus kocurii TaxID=427078 RepID=UPI00036A46E6|nr:TAXI family TRAP transporter solute-binding subunit [Salsuginibacillus kocurii]
MRNLVAGFLVVGMTSGLLAACGEVDEGTDSAESEEEETGESNQSSSDGEEENYNIATATSAGIYYALGNGLGQLWSDEIDGVTADAQSTAGSPQNINYLHSDDAQIGIVQNGVALQAWEGTGDFEEPMQDMRAFSYLYPNLAYFVVRADSGIETLQDLEGTEVAPGPVGSGTEVNAREILEEAGIYYENEENASPNYMDNAESATALVDNHVDMTYIAGGIPHASVTEMTTSIDVNILPVEGEVQERVIEEYEWYFDHTIPGGTYDGLDDDIESVAVANMLIGQADTPDDVVYDMLDTMYENTDRLKSNFEGASEFTPEDGMDGVTIPLHPGAVEYFEDQGVEVPEELIPED